MTILHTFPAYNVFLCSVVAISTGLVVPRAKRIWGLTAVMAPLFTVIGTAEFVYWLRTGDTISGPDTVALAQLIKAYLLVDLCYVAFIDFWRVPLLTGWIHHIGYLYVADHLLATHQDGVARIFLVAELPTAILAWGHIAPHLRADNLFGATFFLTRITIPILACTYGRFSNFVWSVMSIAITVHAYWFGRWIASRRGGNATTD
jgi:hypothetical protein